MIAKEIDMNKIITADDLEYKVINPIKGLESILDSLSLSDDIGGHRYTAEGFIALAMICEQVINNAEELRIGLKYMHGTLAEVKNG